MFFHQLHNEVHDFTSGLAVEITRGLVAQQECGVGDNGAGNRHPLFLPSRKLARVVIHAVGETDHPERGFDMLPALGFGKPGEQEGQFHVLESGQDRNQVVHLEDKAHVACAPGREPSGRHVSDLIAGHRDAAGGRQIEPSQQVEERGLARAAGTHEGDELAFVDVQVQALKDVDLLAAALVLLVQVAHSDQAGALLFSINPHHVVLLHMKLESWLPSRG